MENFHENVRKTCQMLLALKSTLHVVNFNKKLLMLIKLDKSLKRDKYPKNSNIIGNSFFRNIKHYFNSP